MSDTGDPRHQTIEVARLRHNTFQLGGMFGFEGVGDGYLKARQKEDAVRAYQRALELDPGNNGIAQKLARAKAN